MTRQKANYEIVAEILKAIDKFPDQRFHQILQNLGIEIPGLDQFFDESTETLDAAKKSRFSS